nr:hypothetical protein [Tanacetum cinerariifolium]
MCLWTPNLPNTLLQLKRFPKAKSLELEVDSPFTYHIKAICNLDVSVDSKSPKYSSPTKEKETISSSAIDTSPIHPSPPTPVVSEMHKEVQQAAGGPTSIEDTSKDGAHPQLSSRADDISQKVKLEDLANIMKDTRSAFFTPNSRTDEPIIISDMSKEEENAKNNKDTKDTSVPPPSLKLAQLQKLMAKLELSKLFALHDFASCLPTKLKELPSKIILLSIEIKELKKHIKDMEIELPMDLKEIPSKLETFTSTISDLSSQEKVKTLDSLLGLLKMATNTLNKFTTLVENASGATITGVPSVDKETASPAEGEKDANTNLKNELVDLLGIDIIT